MQHFIGDGGGAIENHIKFFMANSCLLDSNNSGSEDDEAEKFAK